MKISYFYVHGDELKRINDGLECRKLSVHDVISITYDPDMKSYAVFFRTKE
jgi:hypothetical protein